MRESKALVPAMSKLPKALKPADALIHADFS